MAEYSIVQDFNMYNTNLHNTIKMNQVSLNKESIFLIRESITDFGESISTKNILTLEKINGKSFDKDIIEKIEDHAETIEDHASTLADYLFAINTNNESIIGIKNAQTAAAAATAAVDSKTNDNTNRINLANNEIGAQKPKYTNLTNQTTDNSNSITALSDSLISLYNGLNDWRGIINQIPGVNVSKL